MLDDESLLNEAKGEILITGTCRCLKEEGGEACKKCLSMFHVILRNEL
jgi:hypothetical protein